ncbi:MAG TPA: OsmC family protein [Candidatus Desulfobacillus sp.]|nr:OsmC family protein [Candidatus Desulfobacillus sp.]
MSENPQISFTLEQQEDFAFLLRFDGGLAPLLADEPPPLGKGAGPNPERLLLAGIANCLSASLLFALRKYKNQPGRIVTSVSASNVRNAAGRLRVGGVKVSIRIDSPAAELQHLERTLAQFEDFCVVTQSVRDGIDVEVRVLDASGAVLK